MRKLLILIEFNLNTVLISINLGDICRLPSESGMCYANFPKWYFNFADGECQQFTYGGCGGNENRFDSQQECQNTCNQGGGGGAGQGGSVREGEKIG